MSKVWLWVLVSLCCISLILSVFLFVFSSIKAAPAEPAPYILRDWHGQAALFRAGESVPLESFSIYTHLLPEPDAESLRKGIPLRNMEEADRLLEDFGA